MSKLDSHREICKELNSLYRQKNKAYGDAFGQTYKELGIISAVTRMNDKMNRLKTLITKPDVPYADESIDDTLMDLANYAIMTLIELREVKQNEEPEEPESAEDEYERWCADTTETIFC